ncbi:MAG: hypothetical protein NE330_07340, partial [Lentisphaeraceae bacterium]|nr:hypothetical protein [Lentisphaeraceae bacterium]
LATLPWSLSLINNDLLQPSVNGLYIEHHPAYWLVLQVRKGRISECQIIQGHDLELPEEVLVLLRDEQFTQCQFISDLHNLSEFKEILFREEELEEVKTLGNALTRTAGVVAWGLASQYCPAAATVSVPLVPIRQSPKFWWSVAVLTCVIFNSAYFYSLHKKKSVLESKLQAEKSNNIKLKGSTQLKRDLKKKHDSLLKQLEELKGDNEELKKLSLNNDSADFVKELLIALAKVNLSGIKITHFDATNERTFKIAGLSTKQNLPYSFSSALAEKISGLNPLVSVKQTNSYYSFELTTEQLTAGKRSK